MCPKPDCLSQGRGETVGARHHPRLPAVCLPAYGGNAGAEGEAFEGLVKDDGDEEDDERGADGDGEGHADEHAVEQNPHLQQQDLERSFFENLLLAEVELVVGDWGGGWWEGEVVEAGGYRVGAGAPLSGHAEAEAADAAAAADALGLGRGATHRLDADVVVGVILGVGCIGDSVVGGICAGGLLIAAVLECGVFVVGLGVLPLAQAAGEDHLHERDKEHGDHGDGAGHRRVGFVPEFGEARVGEGDEGGGEEVDKGGGDEDAGAEVAGEEEEGGGDAKARETFGDQWEGAGCGELAEAGGTGARRGTECGLC